MKNFSGNINDNGKSLIPTDPVFSGNRAALQRMSRTEIEDLLYKFQARQIELVLQNENLRENQHNVTLSRDRYAQLYDFAPLGYLTLDEDGFFLQANVKAADILGHKKRHLADKKLAEFILQEDKNKFLYFWNSLSKYPKKNSIVLRLKANQTHYSTVELHGMAARVSDNTCLFLMTVNDISQSKSAEATIRELNLKLEEKVFRQTVELLKTNRELQEKVAELAKSRRELMDHEAKLNSIFNAAVEGIITIDDSGIIESINAAVTTIFGYQRNELLGQHISVLMPLKDGKKHDKYLSHYLNTHKSHLVGSIREFQGKHKDGTLVPIDLSLAEFEIDNKRFYTGILRDATKRKYKEQKDKEHLSELAHVTRLGLMGEMASGIAHEVNQPLTAIANYTQACLNFLQSPHFDRLRIIEILNKANEQAIKAGQIIHRMREFVRSRKIHPSKVYINELVKTALALCHNETLQLQIKVKTDLSDSLPTVYADFIQIEQVLLNLIRNSFEALQSMPEKHHKLLIIHTCLNQQNQVEVSIKDNGPGFNEKQKRQVFTPFYTTKSMGMGMGLSISRSIIEAHNGVLRFESTKNKGATFYFTLPKSV